MVECENCKYFISYDTIGQRSHGFCSIILPPWLKVEDKCKTVYPNDYCDLGVENNERKN